MKTNKTIMNIAVALMMGAGLGGFARAQDPEVGNTAGYGSPAQVQDSDFDYGGVDLKVAVWLDRNSDEIYQRNDEMGVGFQTNVDAYAVVYRIDVDGVVSVLWPRSRFDDGFVFGGHEYLLPVSGAKALRTSSREGEGYVEAVVSMYPFDLRDLEIDFHHEPTSTNFDFLVAGDPFLAMNEVNFAVTGLEDSEEFVTTNYMNYYVHRAVDHPRYLCNQCHFEEDTVYRPYQDEYTLEIQYDYGWSNDWYDQYGYYPVYVNPVYVYVDPWTWRPWVNFWFYPSYVCAPSYGYSWWGPCYSWGYSPYYRGDCYSYASSGYTRYRPLNKQPSSGVATKTREYDRVSPMMKKGQPDSRQKQAMRDRTVVADGARGKGSSGAVSGRSSFQGQDPATRTRTSFKPGTQAGGNPGLRIRDGGSVSKGTRSGTGSARKTHTAAGADSRSTLSTSRSGMTPLRGSSSGSIGRSNRSGGGTTPSARTQDRRSGSSLKTVEPRKKGTRIWNSGSSGQAADRKARSGQVRPGSSSSKRTSPGVSPKRGSGSVKKSSAGGSRSTVKSRPKSSGGSGSSSSVKSRSGGGSKSSGSRSSGGGSKSSGGGSSGGSRSGGSRGSSRSGGGR